MGRRYGRPVLGIDLRGDLLRAAVVRRGAGGWQLREWQEVPIPEQVPVEEPRARRRGRRGRQADGGEPPQEAFRSDPAARMAAALKQLKPRASRVAVAVGFQHVLVRRLTFPRLPLSRVRQLVEQERDRYIPFYNEGAHFDLRVLNPDPKASQMDVLLVAVPSRLIQPIRDACRQARLRVAAIDIDLAALLRGALAAEPESDTPELAAILEVGGAGARMGLFHQGHLLAGRGFETAELPAADLPVEVRRSLEVLLSQQRTAPGQLSRLYVAGPGADDALVDALLPVLREDIGGMLAEDFTVRRVAPPGADAPPALAVAFGSALAPAAPPAAFHLLPRLTWEERRLRRRRALWTLAGLAAVGVYGWYWSLSVPEAQFRIEQAQRQIQTAQEQLKRRGEIERLEARHKRLAQVIADLRVIESPLHETVPAIAALAPEGLVFTDMTAQVPQIALRGRAQDPALVVELIARLSAAPYVADLTLRSVTEAGEDGYQFDLTITLKGQTGGKGRAAAGGS